MANRGTLFGKLAAALFVFAAIFVGIGFASTTLSYDDGSSSSTMSETRAQYAVKFTLAHKANVENVWAFVAYRGGDNDNENWQGGLLYGSNHSILSSYVSGSDASNFAGDWKMANVADRILPSGASFYAAVNTDISDRARLGNDTGSTSGYSEDTTSGSWVARTWGNHMIRAVVNYFPEASSLSVTPYYANNRINITATCTEFDPGDEVDEANYRIDDGPWLDMQPADGAFNEDVEDVRKLNRDVNYLSEGIHTVYVRCQDEDDNWGDSISGTFLLDETDPDTDSYLTPGSPDGENNWYVSDVTLTLTTEYDLSGIAYTEYRTKFNSIYWGPWTSYTSPVVFSADGYYHVEYRSEDNAGNLEDPGMFDREYFKIDQTAPSTPTIDPGFNDGDGDFYVDWSPASDGMSGLDGYNVYRSIDGAEFSLISSNQNPSDYHQTTDATDSEFRYYVTSVDNAGNEGSASDIQTVIEDRLPPSAPALHALPPFLGSDTVPLSWDAATDAGTYPTGISAYDIYLDDSFYHSVSGGTLSDAIGTFVHGDTPEFYLTAWDNSDPANEGPESDSETTSIDLVPPETYATISPETPDGENGWYVTTPFVTLSATDNDSGVAWTSYWINGEPETNYTGAFGLADGTSSVSFYSVDNAGNYEDVNSTGPYYVDTAAPEGQWIYLNTETDIGSMVTIDEYTNDPMVTAEYAVGYDYTSGLATCVIDWGDGNSTPVYPEQGPAAAMVPTEMETHLYPDGIWQASLTCEDAAGNENTAWSNVIFVDTVPPVVTGAPTTEPNENGWYNDGVTVHFECTDVDGSGPVEETHDEYLGSEGADQSASWTCYDMAGNSNWTEVTGINIDLYGPWSSATFEPEYPNGEDGWYNTTVEFNLSATDDPYEVLNGGFHGSGVNRTLYCVDYADYEYDGCSADAGADFYCEWRCTPDTEYTGPFNVTLQGRNIWVGIMSIDNAGNEEENWYVGDFSIDSEAPESAITYPLDGGAFGLTTLNITGNASDWTSGLDRVEINITGTDGSNVMNWTEVELDYYYEPTCIPDNLATWNYSSWTIPGYGAYRIYVRATDDAGTTREGAFVTISVPAPKKKPTGGYSPTCGNGICAPGVGETYLTCPADCPAPQPPAPPVTTTTVEQPVTTTTVEQPVTTTTVQPQGPPTGQFILFDLAGRFWNWLSGLFG